MSSAFSGGVKQEPLTGGQDINKDFLFDPFAAAYYSKFTEFNPLEISLKSFLLQVSAQ